MYCSITLQLPNHIHNLKEAQTLVNKNKTRRQTSSLMGRPSSSNNNPSQKRTNPLRKRTNPLWKTTNPLRKRTRPLQKMNLFAKGHTYLRKWHTLYKKKKKAGGGGVLGGTNLFRKEQPFGEEKKNEKETKGKKMTTPLLNWTNPTAKPSSERDICVKFVWYRYYIFTPLSISITPTHKNK